MAKAYLEPPEIEKLEEAALYLRDKLLIRLVFHTGCRIGEVPEIRIEDIDFKQGALTIRHVKARTTLSCSECGGRLSKTQKFCPTCGLKVENTMTQEKVNHLSRLLRVDKNTLAMMQEYIGRGGVIPKHGERFIFNIGRHRVWQIINNCAQKAGVLRLAKEGDKHDAVASSKGGFLRPFGCGWFIREFLLGNGPEGSIRIDPERGAPQSDINYQYKEALARATARERAERIISNMVLSGADISEERAETVRERELKKISRKFSHARYHSFLMYFSVLKRLKWVQVTEESEPSSIQDNFPSAPGRIFFRLTAKGREAGDELWSNPLFTLYPEVGRSHLKKTD